MPVLSDKWIKKNAKSKGMIRPFISKQVRKGKFLLAYHHTVMMPGYLMNLKYLLMLTQVLLIQKFLKKKVSLLKEEKNVLFLPILSHWQEQLSISKYQMMY